jgi:hypothetical protein
MTQVALILPQSITAIGTFSKFDNSYLNAGKTDYVAIDPSACSGFGDAPPARRSTTRPASTVRSSTRRRTAASR